MSNERRLRRKARNARRATHDMILTMAKYGDNGPGPYPRFKTDAEVDRFLRREGGSLEFAVEECRTWAVQVPYFENLLGSTWQVAASGGASVSIVDFSAGQEEEVAKVEGTGQISFAAYRSRYENAQRALDRAIQQADWGEVLSAISSGVAAIEAYISQCAARWNRAHPSDQLIDSKASKVSFEDKLRDWIPKMTGQKVDRSDEVWRDFVVLRGIRDDEAIHIKNRFVGVSHEEMAATINRFRAGIAQMLLRLHMLFREPIPSQIIRGAFAPEVEVISEEAAAAS